MISVAEALSQVLEHVQPKPAADVPLDESLGLVLAEDTASDVDSPPHDKSMVDGFAVAAVDLKDGRATLGVLEEITAGMVPSRKVVPGFCSRIMTGAPIPEGADSIVMVERAEFNPSPHHDESSTLAPLPQGKRGSTIGTVAIQDERFRAGQNIMRRGKSLRLGETVLKGGAELGPAEIGLLAEVGRAKIRAIGPVQVAIVSTGNELVAADQRPHAGQIRNSNGPLMAAAVRRAGAVPMDLGIVRDDTDELRRAIVAGLKSDILVISGGVSAGVLDLVPSALADVGVRQVFHKIDMKPGRPLWFGVYDGQNPRAEPEAKRRTLVFGLPGNPVSTLVCFELFVKPAIARIAGRHWEPPHPTRSAKLTVEFTHRGDRPTYWPAMFIASPDGPLVEPRPWQGSADIRGFAGANALVAFSAGERRYQAGDSVDVVML
jgi:molybdopterin molybdotransferase